MNPVTRIEDAIELIAAYEGRAEDFELPIAEALLDPMGLNMAVITDHILDKGWEPDGVEQKDGYRVYHYKSA